MSQQARQLAACKRGSVVAAAGCGKTEVIARAAAVATGRQLILTHTNAGVEAIRRRLRRFGVSREQTSVDTIDGWSQKYLYAYPGKSGGVPTNAKGGVDWDETRIRMEALLNDRTIRKVVDASYTGVFVDEYQDCDPSQHALMIALAAQLPVRVFGDPLQAVFGFAGELPSWTEDVEAEFPKVDTLTTPWRWKRDGHNAALGDWLTDARAALEARRSVDLSDERLHFIQIDDPSDWQGATRDACFDLARKSGSVAVVFKWRPDGQLLGKLTGSLVQSVEPVESKDGASVMSQLQGAAPGGRTRILMRFVYSISASSKEPLTLVKQALDGVSDTPPAEVRRAADALAEVAAGGSPYAMAEALDALARLARLKVYRRELLWAVINTLRDVGQQKDADLVDALRRRRCRTSHVGRRLARLSAGSTLLLKGMEFDHAVVVDTGKFTVNDLYVAITRGSRSLTVISATPVVDPTALATV